MAVYGEKESKKEAPKKESKKEAPKKSMGKMSEKQKADLKKHMEGHKDKMSASEMKSHRMKMMSRMRKGMSIKEAHDDI